MTFATAIARAQSLGFTTLTQTFDGGQTLTVGQPGERYQFRTSFHWGDEGWALEQFEQWLDKQDTKLKGSLAVSIIEHIQQVAKTDPVEAADMLVKSTTQPDPADPMKLPWSVDAALLAYQRIIGLLTPEQVEQVRSMQAVQ